MLNVAVRLPAACAETETSQALGKDALITSASAPVTLLRRASVLLCPSQPASLASSVLSVATLIGEAIERTASEESVSSLFD